MRTIFLLLMAAFSIRVLPQVAINTDGTLPNASAMLDVKSSSRGLLVPRMTQAQRIAISNPATGLMVFQTDEKQGYYYNGGTPAVPLWKKMGDLELPYARSASSSGALFDITNESSTILSYGIKGTAVADNGYGIWGLSIAPTGANIGVYGTAISSHGSGIKGYTISSTGATYGVHGESRSRAGYGVYGIASADSGTTYGVYGLSESVENGYGVYGKAPKGTGVYGSATGTTGTNYGVYGVSYAAAGIGITGMAVAIAGTNYGVYGQSASSVGYGVYGKSPKYGVYGLSSGSQGRSVSAEATGVASIGVYARALAENSTGVWGEGDLYDFYATGPGTNYGAASSIRWKTNIVPIDKPLDMISALRGVYFDWNAANGGKHDVGMIAEEVGKVLPEIVVYEANGTDASGMDYSKLTPLLIEGLKALKAENDLLKARLEKLEKLLDTLTKQ